MSPGDAFTSGLTPEQEKELVGELARLEPVQDALEQPGALTDPIEIIDHGQIGRLVIPEGWSEVESESVQGIGTRSSRIFKPIGEEEARLCLFYRGLPIGDADSSAFKEVLAHDPRDLNEGDIESIAEVLGSKADPEHFRMDLCRVENFKGRTVLTVKGKYLTTDERVFELFIDADGSGRFVQQIYFQAPEGLYERFEKNARSALKSLEWRGFE